MTIHLHRFAEFSSLLASDGRSISLTSAEVCAMAESFVEVMESWRERISLDLRKYKWWPFVGIIITLADGILEHRFYSAINSYIDARWAGSLIATSVSRIF